MVLAVFLHHPGRVPLSVSGQTDADHRQRPAQRAPGGDGVRRGHVVAQQM